MQETRVLSVEIPFKNPSFTFLIQTEKRSWKYYEFMMFTYAITTGKLFRMQNQYK